MTVAGVDGCRAGWLCLEQRDNAVCGHVAASFGQLLGQLQGASVIAVDIPIGLPQSGARPCDVAARKMLGRPRGSSVFPTPVRAVLSELHYGSACRKHREVDGRGLSKQTFAILPKIREVDSLLSPGLQQRVREIHPEVSFAVWNGASAMRHAKASPEGRAERERLIDAEWPGQRLELIGAIRSTGYQPDDLNDAFAALWTAKRIALGLAQIVGPQSTDQRGLHMEMFA